MKNLKNKLIYLLVILVISPILHAPPYESEKSLCNQETENLLLNSEVILIEKNLEMGRTDFWKVALKDGEKELKALFKHVNRLRPALLPDSYKYEIAAYKLNKMLGLCIVPPVIERKINGQIGSLQLMIENLFTERERKIKNLIPENSQQFQNDLDVIKIFEILVSDQCYDSPDIIIQSDTWRVWRVDFSEAFSPSSFDPDKCSIQRCSKDLFENLNSLDKSDLKTLLKLYLNKEEINFLLERRQDIIKTIKNLIKQKGEQEVLY